MVHIEVQECISGHTALPGKSLHQHFILDTAICFIALSVYYARLCFLSGRMCPVSLSSIDFSFSFLFSPDVVWKGERSEGGDSTVKGITKKKA